MTTLDTRHSHPCKPGCTCKRHAHPGPTPHPEGCVCHMHYITYDHRKRIRVGVNEWWKRRKMEEAAKTEEELQRRCHHCGHVDHYRFFWLSKTEEGAWRCRSRIACRARLTGVASALATPR